MEKSNTKKAGALFPRVCFHKDHIVPNINFSKM